MTILVYTPLVQEAVPGHQGDRFVPSPNGQGPAPPVAQIAATLDHVLTSWGEVVLLVSAFDRDVVTRRWPVTWASSGAADLLGSDQSQLVGADLWDLLPGIAGSPQQQLLVEAVRGGTPAKCTWTALGAARSMELRASGGRPVVIRAKDVTEQERARLYSARLLQLSEDLAGAWEPDDVAAAVGEVMLPLAGVDGGGVIIADVGRGVMDSLGWSGAVEELGRAWSTYPLTLRTPGIDAWRNGRPVLLRDAGTFLARYPHLAADFSRLDRQAVAALPMRTATGPMGALIVNYSAARSFPAAEVQFLSTVAAICAQALTRAHLYLQERASIDMLQRSLLPRVVPQPPGTRVAARYQPGHSGIDVGGDWWDVITLPGSVALVLGDVEGHDLSAAALMAQVRSAVRSYALEGLSPSMVVHRTDTFLNSLSVDRLVTMLYLQLHPNEHLVTAVSAGHPAALVGAPGVATVTLPHALGPPLGVNTRTPRIETTSTLPDAATLLMFSDGLVERRHEDWDRRLALVRGLLDHSMVTRPPLDIPAAGPEIAGSWLDEMADAVLRDAAEGSPTADDVALLAVAVTTASPKAGERVLRRLPAIPASVPVARRFLEHLLRAWGMSDGHRPVNGDLQVGPKGTAIPDFVAAALLCTSEVVTNATRHSSDEVLLGITVDEHRLLVEVTDNSYRLPQQGGADHDHSTGRGLQILTTLSSDWGVESNGLTKTVWFTMTRPGRAVG